MIVTEMTATNTAPILNIRLFMVCTCHNQAAKITESRSALNLKNPICWYLTVSQKQSQTQTRLGLPMSANTLPARGNVTAEMTFSRTVISAHWYIDSLHGLDFRTANVDCESLAIVKVRIAGTEATASDARPDRMYSIPQF
jgi:hypothetical protein